MDCHQCGGSNRIAFMPCPRCGLHDPVEMAQLLAVVNSGTGVTAPMTQAITMDETQSADQSGTTG